MPIYEITSPDGKILEITAPEGASMDDVLSYAKQNYKIPQKTIMGDLGQSLFERGKKVFEQYPQAAAQGKETQFENIVKSVGQGFGAAGDIGYAGLRAADYGLGGAPSALIGGAANLALENLPAYDPTGQDRNLKQMLGQEAQAIGSQYGQFSKTNPRTAGMLEAAANIAGGLALPTVSKAAGNVLEASGEAVGQAAKKQEIGKIIEAIREPVSGTKNKKTIEQGLRTREKGLIIKRDVIMPSKDEIEIAETVSKIPNFGGSNRSMQNKITDYNKAHSVQLYDDVLKNNVPVAPQKLQIQLDDTYKKLKNKNFIQGNAGKYAKSIIREAENIFKRNNDYSAAGVLKARKQLDNWITEQENLFSNTDEYIKPKKKAALELRRAMNNLVDELMPENVGVKQRLREEHNLYRAEKSLVQKAQADHSNSLKRIIEKVNPKLAGGVGLTAASAYGLGGLPSLTPLALIGGTLYFGGKALGSVQAKKILSGVLTGAGKILGADDKKVIKEIIEDIDKKEMLALPAPNKFVTSNDEIAAMKAAAEAQSAKAGAGVKAAAERAKAESTPMITPVQGGQAAIPIERRLPAPEQYIAGREGVRKASSNEIEIGNIARNRAEMLGLTSDVRKNIWRNEIEKKFQQMGIGKQNVDTKQIWNKIEKSKQDKILNDVEKAYKQNLVPVEKIINDAASRTNKLFEELGEKPFENQMMQALKNAKPIKRSKLNE